jgi:hypothetical protein
MNVSGNAQDEQYQLALDDAIGFVEWYTSKKFSDDNIVLEEEFDIKPLTPNRDYSAYFLHNYPVKSIEQVTFYDTVLSTNDYTFNKRTGKLIIAGSVWSRNRQYTNFGAVKVDYTYGYADVPDAINAVIAQLAIAIARGAGQSLSSEKTGDYQIMRANYLGMISQDMMAVLKSYAKVR